jgi:hypothetical protein
LSLLSVLALGCGKPGPGQDGEAGSSETGEETGGELECPEGSVLGDDGECHCGAAEGPVCGEGAYCDAANMACVEAVCGEVPPWSPGTQAFA